MKKLSPEQIRHLAYYQEAIDKAYKTQIYFCFRDKDSGAQAYEFLKNVYADECNYDAWSGWFGLGDKRDFYLGFVSPKARDEVYDDIRHALDAYQSTNQYQNDNLNGNGLSGGGGGNSPTDPDPDTDKKSIDWTTYIIIGAAAVAIIILLWPNKRRK